MEFWIEKRTCYVHNGRDKKRNNGWNRTRKSEKHQNTCRKRKCQVLRNFGSEHPQIEMKNKVRKEYLRGARKFLESKLCSRNLIKGIKALAVLLVRYSGSFLKWTRETFRQMDQRTRKLMTMPNILYPRDDTDTL